MISPTVAPARVARKTVEETRAAEKRFIVYQGRTVVWQGQYVLNPWKIHPPNGHRIRILPEVFTRHQQKAHNEVRTVYHGVYLKQKPYDAPTPKPVTSVQGNCSEIRVKSLDFRKEGDQWIPSPGQE